MREPSENPVWIILGAGITGLSLALAARKKGIKPILLEPSGRAGGSILTYQENGYILEAGPNTMMLKSREVENFLREFVPEETWRPADSGAGKRFIVRRGKVLAVPTSPSLHPFSRLERSSAS